MCDGVRDCPYGEEEEVCIDSPLHCPGYFSCKGGACVALSQVCDGDLDCVKHKDDESYCNMDLCPVHCICVSLAVNCLLPEGATVDRLEFQSIKYVKIVGKLRLVPHIQRCVSCIVINLAGNFIKAVKQHDFQELSTVAIMDLGNNNISDVEARSFQSMPNLRILKLGRNPLLGLSSKSFLGLHILDSLQMSHVLCKELPILPNSKSLKYLIFLIVTSKL